MSDQLPTPADSPQVVTTEPSTTSTTSSEDHLAQGIRFLALSKYSQASESLSYAVELLTLKNGELSIENVEALILYGKALLGNAIEQSKVLGLGGGGPQQLPGTATDEPSTSTSSSSAAAGPSTTTTSTSAAFHFGGDGDDYDEEEGQDEGEGEGEEEEEKEDDFESAFVALDLARRSIELEVDRLEQEIKNLTSTTTTTDTDTDTTKKKKKVEEIEKDKIEKKEKLAQVHRLLGDVATESEQFENAVEEYSSALSILTNLRSPLDRVLSEQHMLIALALEFIPNQLNRSINHAEKSKSVLVMRLKELENKVQQQKQGEGKDDKDEDKENEKDLKEIQDLKELIKDVDDKIEDLKTVPTAPEPSTSDLALQDYLRQAALGGGGSTTSLPVNDLNSLVKKKKKQPTTTTTEVQVEGKGKGKRKAEEQEGGEKAEEGKVEEKKLKV
ncbi:hypothetical protein JCM3765_004010 [Sporobolomyces pararoseus]